MALIEAFSLFLKLTLLIFVPGFVWSFVFWPKKDEIIDRVERFFFSFGLSITIIPMTVMFFNLLGVKISTFSIYFEIIIIFLVGVIFIHRQS